MPEGWSYYLDFKDETFELQDGEQTVGRSRTCDFSIDDPSVSRRHVLVRADGGRVLLEDLGSSNGTFINGDRIEGGHELRDGDTLGLGDADLKVRVVATSAFQTVRLSSHPLEPHGEATLFLQKASEKLAAEAMDHGEELAAEAPSHMAPPPIQPAAAPPEPAPPRAPSHMTPPPLRPAAVPPESPAPPPAPPEPPPVAAPRPVAPAPVAPEPVAPAPVAPEPVAPEPVAPAPVAPAPVAPPPLRPAAVPPESSAPPPAPPEPPPVAAPRPVAPAPVAPAPVAPAPVAPAPVAPEPAAPPPVAPPPLRPAAVPPESPAPPPAPPEPPPVAAPRPVAPAPAAPTPAAPTPAAPTPVDPVPAAPPPPPAAAPVAPAPPAAPPAVALGAQSVLDRTAGDQATGDLLPSLDGFDITMGPEMMQAVKPRVEERSTAATEAHNPYGAPEPQALEAAGFGIRLAACLVDVAWILALNAFAYLSVKSLGPSLAYGTAAGAAWLVVLFGWAIWGTTPGKRVFNLYVTSGAGGEAGIGFPRALARSVGYALSSVLGIGFLMIAFSPSKRGLHDLIAGTRVERQA